MNKKEALMRLSKLSKRDSLLNEIEKQKCWLDILKDEIGHGEGIGLSWKGQAYQEERLYNLLKKYQIDDRPFDREEVKK